MKTHKVKDRKYRVCWSVIVVCVRARWSGSGIPIFNPVIDQSMVVVVCYRQRARRVCLWRGETPEVTQQDVWQRAVLIHEDVDFNKHNYVTGGLSCIRHNRARYGCRVNRSISVLWLIHTTWDRDLGSYREWGWHSGKQWVLVPAPVLGQWEHFDIKY